MGAGVYCPLIITRCFDGFTGGVFQMARDCGSGCPSGRAVTRLFVLAFLALASFSGFTQKGHAQTAAPAAAPSAAAQASAPAASADGLFMGGDHRVLVFKVRDALGQALQSLDVLPQLTTRALLERSPDGTLDWVWKTAVVLVLAILAGTAVLRLVERWGRLRFLRFYDAALPERADRIAYLLSRAAIMAIALAGFAAVSVVIALAFVSGHPPSRVTALVGLEAVATFLLLRIVLLNVLAPGVSAQRMLRLEDRDAHGLYRSLIGLAALSHALFALCGWMAAMGLDPNAHKLALIFSTGVACLLLSAVVVFYRKALTGLFAAPQQGGAVLGARHRVATLVWLPLTLLYFAGAFLVSTVRVLLDLPAALGLVGAPIMALLIWATGYGVLVLVIDKWLLPRLDSDSAQARAAEDLSRVTETLGEGADEDASLAQARAEAMDAEGARSPYRRLLEHGAAIISLVAAAAFLLRTWGIPLGDDSFFLANLFEIGLIVFLGYMAYEAVAIAIDRQIMREGGGADKKDDDHEVGGAGESRLATLLPIFRNFLLITIVVIAGMVALSHLGVNIAPLFAGAGVVGLAVGFGSQTLIRDIFSGAFFLVDDAFRKGEYIDIGSVKGTVEKISIRSMQLRHHNGPLNTVPFGEIRFVKNFSRDWAVMKLAFRVTYDTDVEKMRKLIKKFGQELLEHPEYGPKFLQPVKSQGVTALEDSAMIVRVKFMTRPGDQFELRKVVYAGIRDLCEREGIHFAHREVTVRVSQDPNDPREFSEAEKKAIGGAVLPTLEEGKAAGTSAAADDGR
ncbi:MAG: mechanosensitive ion channel protein [Rhodobacteraceae bacterium]|nr:mechanosensitive ion channel protein [Paracoccaceae bacterium]